MNEMILQSVQTARSSSKKRKFSQSFDLIINLKMMDTRKPENRISEIVSLPKGRGNDAKITIFSDEMKNEDYEIYGSSDVENFVNNMRKLKKLASGTDFFLADPKMMVTIGKNLGRILAPRGKMPTPISGESGMMINKYKHSIRLIVKESPVIQCIVGVENMKDEDVAENVEFVLNFLEKRLPKGRNNIGTIMVKMTMGKPAKLQAQTK